MIVVRRESSASRFNARKCTSSRRDRTAQGKGIIFLRTYT